MKAITRIFIASALLGGISTTANAERYTNEDGQQVECHEKEVQGKGDHPVAAPLAGAVIGGVVGHQFGSGSGNKAATAAGALGGAYGGKKYNDKRAADGTTVQEVCRPVR